MYKFHYGFRADKELFGSHKWQWGTTGNHSEIRNVNLYYPVTAKCEKTETNIET